MLAFLHIPKTAGTSFGMLLHYRYGDGMHELGNALGRPDELEHAPADASAVEGHVSLGALDRLAPGATLATLLRDPVERTLSEHRYLAAGRGRGFLARGLPEPPPGIPLRDALEGGYMLDNLQTRMLCGIDSPRDPLPPDAADRAAANLARFGYLGVTERFDEFVALIGLGLGWPTIVPFEARVNRPTDPPDPEDVRLAAAANELDAEVYRQADALAAEAAARAGSALADELAVMRGDGDAARVELARKEREIALLHDEVRQLKRKLKLRRRELKERRR
jgi:hypothetical protein